MVSSCQSVFSSQPSHTAGTDDNKEESCAICLESLHKLTKGPPKNPLLFLHSDDKVKHVFHTYCILIWLLENNICPTCRKNDPFGLSEAIEHNNLPLFNSIMLKQPAIRALQFIPLRKAAERGDVNRVTTILGILKSGGQFPTLAENQWPTIQGEALTQAAGAGHLDCVRVLLKGCDTNQTDKLRALFASAVGNYLDCSTAILQSDTGQAQQIFPDSWWNQHVLNVWRAGGKRPQTAQGFVLSSFITENGTPSYIEFLLQRMDCSLQDKWLALCTSIELARIAHMQILLTYISPADQDVLLLTAVTQGSVDVLNKILNYGETTPSGRRESLLRATSEGNLECEQAILERDRLFSRCLFTFKKVMRLLSQNVNRHLA